MKGLPDISFEHIVIVVPIHVASAHDGPPGQFGMTGVNLVRQAAGSFGDDFERAGDRVKGFTVFLESFKGKPLDKLARIKRIALSELCVGFCRNRRASWVF